METITTITTLTIENEAREVRGTYAEAVAAFESWEHGCVRKSPGGEFTAIFIAPRPSIALAHDVAARRAPYMVDGHVCSSATGAVVVYPSAIVRAR